MFTLPQLSAGQWLVLLVVVGLFVATSIAAIYDAFRRDFGSANAKFGWIQLAVLVPFFGGVAYFLFGRKRGRKM